MKSNSSPQGSQVNVAHINIQDSATGCPGVPATDARCLSAVQPRSTSARVPAPDSGLLLPPRSSVDTCGLPKLGERASYPRRGHFDTATAPHT